MMRFTMGAGKEQAHMLEIHCFWYVQYSTGVQGGKEVENTCSNESVPETLESFQVTISLDIIVSSKSDNDNKFFRTTKKGLSIRQNYDQMLILKWQYMINNFLEVHFEHQK